MPAVSRDIVRSLRDQEGEENAPQCNCVRGAGTGVVFTAFCVVLLVASISLAGPAWGQQGADPGPLAGKPAIVRNVSSPSSPPDVIVIAAVDCNVAADASILLKDEEGDTLARFTNGRGRITITADGNQIRIEGPDDEFIGDFATFPEEDQAFSTRGKYRGVSSTGIPCRGAGNTSQNDNDASDTQYDNFENPDAGDVVNVPDKPLPNTGGALPGLAVAGCVMILLGASLLGAMLRGSN